MLKSFCYMSNKTQPSCKLSGHRKKSVCHISSQDVLAWNKKKLKIIQSNLKSDGKMNRPHLWHREPPQRSVPRCPVDPGSQQGPSCVSQPICNQPFVNWSPKLVCSVTHCCSRCWDNSTLVATNGRGRGRGCGCGRALQNTLAAQEDMGSHSRHFPVPGNPGRCNIRFTYLHDPCCSSINTWAP